MSEEMQKLYDALSELLDSLTYEDDEGRRRCRHPEDAYVGDFSAVLKAVEIIETRSEL